jgi:deazaflavin-dependent oxidoreductase (nitroreductase family)
MRYPSGGLLWFLYRAPLVEWRMGLGLILRRFHLLVLTTRGRKSGKPRHTMLEHSMMGGRAYVAPGWGAKTQWYRNILSDARVTVQSSGKPYGAIARRVTDDDELARLYEVIRGKSPVWRQYLDSWDVQDTVQDFVAKKNRLCVLRLDPLDELPLPGIRTDLVWIWPAAVMVAIAVYFIVR